ncbi:hypothetical protein R9C00_22800 [Flammeovirgaceae bacterium SG7u.111]|nr:hypothetical protein [Flammeovirgaceae bacterium SG7u.132]WPO34534.1 hypothetical protein R9C00_22800 [Flammeovirgaceae bacterium SG7u.111]
MIHFKTQTNVATFIFGYVLIFFFIDCIINYFIHIPVLVISYMGVLPLVLIFSIKYDHDTLISITALTIIVILSSYRYGIKIEDTEFIHIIIYICIITIYSKNITHIENYVHLIFFVSFFLFSFSFIGINQGGLSSTLDAKVSLNDVEYIRAYNNGLFRIPQIATYFFGYIGLVYLQIFFLKRKKRFVGLSIISIFLSLSTGSRTLVVSFLLSFLLYHTKLTIRKLLIVTIFIILTITLIIKIDFFLEQTKGTFIFQYFSFIYSIKNNFINISRIQIWSSWLLEVKEFSLLDWMTGRAFHLSHDVNQERLNYKIWFHNDYLSIFYSYGIFILLFYILFYIKIYFKFKRLIKENIVLFIFFVSIPFCAFFNGFYYYLTPILLYLLFYLIKIVSDYRRSIT